MPVIQTRVSEKEERIIKGYARRTNLSVSELLRESVLSRAASDARLSLYGALKGKIVMAEDFDAPLDDFEEYR
jgi:hypothetical protein